MEIDLTTDQRKFRDELRGYFADMMTDELTHELSSGTEGGGPEFRKAMKQMGQDGLLGLSWPKEYGGQERSAVDQFIFADEVQAIGFPLPFLTLNTVGPTLREYGTEEQKRYFCPRVLAGEIFFAIGYSEPGAGTDLASLQTSAVRDGDDWIINGSKIYITNAATADWLCLLAVTDPDARYGGFSQIIVPTDTPGFRYELLDKIGNWDSDTGMLYFDDVRVPLANTIGEVGRGFQQQMMQFQDERLVACITAVAGSRRIWEITRDYAKERILFGKPLSKMQVTQFKFVDMMIELEAARELTYACVRKRIKGEDATQKISMAKVFCGRTVRHVSDECIQLHGGYGYMKESAAGRAFVDSRLMSIGGGSDETMIHYLAKMLGF